MFFANLSVYKLSGVIPDEETLKAKLDKMAFVDAAVPAAERLGFVPPVSTHDEMLHSVMGSHMLCVKTEKRSVPSDVVKDEVEKIVRQRNAQGQQVSRQDKKEIKELVEARLLPKVLPKIKRSFAYIDRDKKWLVINEASRKQCENIASFLFSATDLAATPVVSANPPGMVVKGWIENNAWPATFTPGARAKLEEISTGATVSYAKHEISEDGWITEYLSEGRIIKEIMLVWRSGEDFVGAVVTDDFQVKSVKYGDLAKEEASEQSDGDQAALFDAEFVITSRVCRDFVDALLEQFGGEG